MIEFQQVSFSYEQERPVLKDLSFRVEKGEAVDPWNRRIVIRTIRELPQTKLITSHDLDMILDTCDRVILLSAGTVAADGPAREVLRDKALLEQHRMELPLSLQSRED